MSKFNKVSTGVKTENLAGGQAYKQNSKMELVSILLTSFVKNQFYRSEDETTKRLKELIDSVDPTFSAKAAIYARNEFGMRSISHITAAAIANKVKGEQWTKSFFDKVVRRPDDMTEIVSYYFNNYDKKLPNSLKKGLAKAFDKFNGYQLSKYRCENKAVKLIDLVNLVHPKPSANNEEALKLLVNNELTNTQTWETKLTQAGQKAENEEEKQELKKEAWKDLLTENKLGYLALLRNIRNIHNQAPECIDLLCKQLTNREAIKKSLVMPVQLIVAYNQLVNIDNLNDRKIIKALSDAMELSLDNTPKFDGKTLIVLDCSGSMEGQPSTIGSLFACALYKTNDADLMLFSDDAEYKALNPQDSLASLVKSIDFASGGTNFHAIFEKANKKYDRVIILSDMQGWMNYSTPTSVFNKYKKEFKTNPFVYSFDLQGYGSLQLPENNVFCLTGFSDKVFDLMKLLEQDRNVLINKIESIVL